MEFINSLLTAASTLLISPTMPDGSSPSWNTTKRWVQAGPALVFEAESTTIPANCKQSPDSYLFAPTVLQGIHEFFIDGKLIYTNGDPTFHRGSSLYNSALVPCPLISSANTITWRVTNLTHAYAKLAQWPHVTEKPPIGILFDKGLTVLAAGSVALIGILSAILFWGSLPSRIPLALLGAAMFTGAFFSLASADVLGISIPTYDLHRIHDACLWIGTIFVWSLFRFVCGIPRAVQIFHGVVVSLAIPIIAVSANLDQSQVGSTLAFLANTFGLLVLLALKTRDLFATGRIHRDQLFQFAAIAAFCLSGINDILINAELIDSFPMFHIGFTSAFILVALAANERILQTYRERDHLRDNLEKEVEFKTKSLAEKSQTLEQTVSNLKQTQAELVQSSKLASLGTLAAGLAHEINNALNFPIAVLPKLRRIAGQAEITSKDRETLARIVSEMGEGLSLTDEIIKNLKGYSRTDAAEVQDLKVNDVIQACLLLLRHKIKEGIAVKVDAESTIMVKASKASISQTLMNLIANAADAMQSVSNRVLTISAKLVEHNFVTISIQDTGPGMTKETLERVFEPFFTTKEVGKGTGLGMYIVMREVNAMGGKIDIDSAPGKGTTVVLRLPTAMSLLEAA